MWQMFLEAEMVWGSIIPIVYGYGLWLFEKVGACEHLSALYPIACRNTFTLECTIICFTVHTKKEQSNLTVVKD